MLSSSYKASSDVDYDNTGLPEFEVGNAYVEEACVSRMSLMIGNPALPVDVIVVFEESCYKRTGLINVMIPAWEMIYTYCRYETNNVKFKGFFMNQQ